MSDRRPYIRPQPRFWWARKPYLGYTIRELSGVTVALYGGVLLVGLICLTRGQAAFDAYRELLTTPWSLLTHLLLLAAMLWHVVTWFQTMPKTMPRMVLLGGRLVSQRHITSVGLTVAFLCSAVLLAAVMFAGARS